MLGLDELEAIRLKDLLSFPQEEAARIMNVSQPTFHRILKEARRKIADVIVHGKALRIEGGPYTYDTSFLRPCMWMKNRESSCEEMSNKVADDLMKKEKDGGKKMRIAITSTGDTLESLIDERFGRAKKIVIYDTDSDSYELIDNSLNLSLAQGAGIQTAQNIVNQGVRAVISGHFGPNAVRVLNAASVEIYQALGMTVAQAIDKFKQGKLERLYGPDKSPHW